MESATGLVLADDTTGALECASLLAGLHLGVTIALSAQSATSSGICVADTESRHIPPADAARRIRQWLRPGLLFKKTDSTLRGNIAAELMGLLDRPVVYLPAYPAMGRTVRNGILYVHGVPVSETEFGHDIRQPVRTSRIADLFPQDRIELIADAPALALALQNQAPRVLLCDAADNEQLTALAGVLRRQHVHTAGPAGFIPFWATLADFPSRHPPPFPRPRKWLVVCGSRHPQSRRQANHAARLGLAVLASPSETESTPDLIAETLARQAAAFIQREHPDAVLIMGGDTVRALWRTMEVDQLTPLPEVYPGIAACLSQQRNLLFVTKAGGFGDDSLVETILESGNRL